MNPVCAIQAKNSKNAVVDEIQCKRGSLKMGNNQLTERVGQHMYIIYDARATPLKVLKKNPEYNRIYNERNKKFGDGKKYMKQFFPSCTDDSAVMVACDTFSEVRQYVEDYPESSCVFKYNVKGVNLVNEQFICTLEDLK